MKNPNTYCTPDEFKAYLLLYAANSNQIVTEEERLFIESKFDPDIVLKMSKELNTDNDYQRLQKILKYMKRIKCTDTDINNHLDEVKFISTTDGTIDVVEQSTHSILSRMLKN